MKNININIDYSDFEIKSGASEQIIVDAHNVNQELLTCSDSEEKFTLVYKKPRKILNIKHNEHINEHIIVTIPESTDLNGIEISMGAGKVSVSEIKANEISLKTGVGDVNLCSLNASGNIIAQSGTGKINLSEISCAHLNLKTGAGEIKAQSCKCQGLDAKTGVGVFSYQGEINGNSEIKTGVGEAKLNISGNLADYAFKISSPSRSVKTGEASESKYICEISCGLGEAKVNFNGESFI